MLVVGLFGHKGTNKRVKCKGFADFFWSLPPEDLLFLLAVGQIHADEYQNGAEEKPEGDLL